MKRTAKVFPAKLLASLPFPLGNLLAIPTVNSNGGLKRMEPLVLTLSCPNCSEAILAFKDGSGAKCEECGFDAEVFADRQTAFSRFQSFLADTEVIAADPVRLGNTRWVVAHTRMMLV